MLRFINGVLLGIVVLHLVIEYRRLRNSNLGSKHNTMRPPLLKH